MPAALNQFNKALDKNQASTLFKLLLKYQPEAKAEKRERLTKEAEARSAGQVRSTHSSSLLRSVRGCAQQSAAPQHRGDVRSAHRGPCVARWQRPLGSDFRQAQG